ncbi:unnamed protein product [Gordionus sp. m RMFG-2023]
MERCRIKTSPKYTNTPLYNNGRYENQKSQINKIFKRGIIHNANPSNIDLTENINNEHVIQINDNVSRKVPTKNLNREKLNHNVNNQFEEFTQLIKLKEENINLKEELLTLKSQFTKTECELEKYKRISKSIHSRGQALNNLVPVLKKPIPTYLSKNEIDKDITSTEYAEKVKIEKFAPYIGKSFHMELFPRKVCHPMLKEYLIHPLLAKAEWNQMYRTASCYLSTISGKSSTHITNVENLPSNPNETPKLDINKQALVKLATEKKFIEAESLRAAVNRLKSQIEVMNIQLGEDKTTAEELWIKLNIEEHRTIGFKMALHLTMQINLLYEVLLSVKEFGNNDGTRLDGIKSESAYNSCENCYEDELSSKNEPEYSTPYTSNETNLSRNLAAEANILVLLSYLERQINHLVKNEGLKHLKFISQILSLFEKSKIVQSKNNLEDKYYDHLSPSNSSYTSNSLTSHDSSSGISVCEYNYNNINSTQNFHFNKFHYQLLKTFINMLQLRRNDITQSLKYNSHCSDESINNIIESCYKNCISNNKDNIKFYDKTAHNSDTDLEYEKLRDIEKASLNGFIDNLILDMDYNNYTQNIAKLNESTIMEDIKNNEINCDLLLENAIIFQEIASVKEQLSYVKEEKYYVEKEKNLLDIRLIIKNDMEKSLKSHINSLESDIRGIQDDMMKADNGTKGDVLKHALSREHRLRNQIQNLLVSMENISKNSEIRYKDAMDIVKDLKRLNCVLMNTNNQAKKQLQSNSNKNKGALNSISDEENENAYQVNTDNCTNIKKLNEVKYPALVLSF